MKISVIVTTYNRPETLLKTVRGLIMQKVTPDEVIIADDGSGDETRQAVLFIKDSAPFPVEHVWQEDLGFRASRIRNKAILKARGEYIVLLDGDCIPDPYFVYDHLNLSETGCFFQGKRVLVGRNLTKQFTYADISRKFNLIRMIFTKDIENGHHIFRMPFFPPHRSMRLSGIRSCNMGFFKKDIFAVNGFNEDFFGWGREDSELAVRFFKYGLMKKTHPFMAVCYHLFHNENDRERLNVNDALLKRAIDGNDYVCINGLSSKNGFRGL